MSKMKRKVEIIFVVLIVILLGIAASKRFADVDKVETNAQVHNHVKSGASDGRLNSSSTLSTTRSTASSWTVSSDLRGLLAAIESVDNAMSILEAARKRPDLGGIHLGRYLINKCQSFLAVGMDEAIQKQLPDANLSTERRVARQKALQSIRTRCAEVNSDAAAATKQWFLNPAPEDRARDPILVLRDGIDRAMSSPQALDTLLKETVATQNPYAVEVVLANLFAKGSDHISFRGEMLSQKDASLLSDAVPLVRCDFGAGCGERAPFMEESCVFTGICHSDLVSQMQTRAYTPAEWERIQYFRSELGSALRAGDYSVIRVSKP